MFIYVYIVIECLQSDIFQAYNHKILEVKYCQQDNSARFLIVFSYSIEPNVENVY